MLSLMTSQTVALSQAKKAASEPRAPERAEHHACKDPLSNVFAVLVEARMRRAEIEIEQHRRLYEGHAK